MIFKKIEETLALGGTGVLMQGGHHPDLGIDYYEDLFSSIKARYPIYLHALSPPEIQHIARRSKLLDPRRAHAPARRRPRLGSRRRRRDARRPRARRSSRRRRRRPTEWLNVMRHAQRLGMSTTATMMYGHVETLAERVEHMRRIRELQDETRGFRAFISWTFQDDGNRLGDTVPPETRPTSFDYLLTQAVSRIYLDNVDHIQSSWVTQGMKIGQVALEFGADDLGSIMIEENVVSAAGTTYRALDRGLRAHDQGDREDPRAARHALPRRPRLELALAVAAAAPRVVANEIEAELACSLLRDGGDQVLLEARRTSRRGAGTRARHDRGAVRDLGRRGGRRAGAGAPAGVTALARSRRGAADGRRGEARAARRRAHAVDQGWFVVNIRDGAWVTNETFGAACVFEGDEAPFPQLGYTIARAPAGPAERHVPLRERARRTSSSSPASACSSIEGEERRLKAWDFVHCPPGTEHIFVGAGDGPCVIFMAGARREGSSIVYPRNELALRHGAGVETETQEPREAYAPFPKWQDGPPESWAGTAVERLTRDPPARPSRLAALRPAARDAPVAP